MCLYAKVETFIQTAVRKFYQNAQIVSQTGTQCVLEIFNFIAFSSYWRDQNVSRVTERENESGRLPQFPRLAGWGHGRLRVASNSLKPAQGFCMGFETDDDRISEMTFTPDYTRPLR